jgi:hypothetical protein
MFFLLTILASEPEWKIINKTFFKSSVINYVAPQIIVNGLIVEILPEKVQVFDVAGDLTKEEALLIVKYLHAEGFILGDKVVVEIITDNDI